MYATFDDAGRCQVKGSGIGVVGIPLPPDLWDIPCHELYLDAFGSVTRRVTPAPATVRSRAAEIAARLTAIDASSSRPLRAIITNAATQADHDRLAALEAEAASLRAELAALATIPTP
ncbi:hypothetical protein [Novispirillum itersonii]|uniref:hypothetical protein n=1 Tax=Novispirillum itersonii TaxID=189 RepID=UPI000379C4E7|nr:hypothetical protein [Novispirillum itersonii]